MNQIPSLEWPPARAAGPLAASLFRSGRGASVRLRPLRGDDHAALSTFLRGLSAQTYAQRYLVPQVGVSEALVEQELTRLYTPGASRRTLLVAQLEDGAPGELLALAELAIGPSEPAVGEIALVVADRYQREGIGTSLGRRLLQQAQRDCVATVQAFALAQNTAIRRLVARLALPFSAETRRGITQFCWALG